MLTSKYPCDCCNAEHYDLTHDAAFEMETLGLCGDCNGKPCEHCEPWSR